MIIGSVFLENLAYENKSFKTDRMDKAVGLICVNHNDLGKKKAGAVKICY
jgi:hypothetical protein